MTIVAMSNTQLDHLISFTVRNTGTVVSDEVVLLFLVERPSDPNDDHTAGQGTPSQGSTGTTPPPGTHLPPPPQKRLVRFLRLHSVAPAASAAVQFTLGAADFHQHGRRSHSFLVEAGVADGVGNADPSGSSVSSLAHRSSPLELL